MTTQVSISCHCTLNSFSIPIPTSSLPLPSRICHCNSCRHSTGSLLLISLPLPNATSSDFPLGATLRAALDGGGKTTTRWFCVKCGAHMLRERASVDGSGGREWVVRVGVVKDWEKLVKIGSHIFVGDTIDGGASILLPGLGGENLPFYSEGAGSPLFQPPPKLNSSSSDISSSSPPSSSSSSKPLLIQCLCTRISLHLSRPSPTSTHLPSSSDISSAPPPTSDERVASSSSSPEPWYHHNVSSHPTTHFLAESCICKSCVQTSGSPFRNIANIPIHLLSLASASASSSSPPQPPDLASIPGLQLYQSSEGVDRFFCSGCGAQVFWRLKKRKELVDVAVGLMRAEEGARAEGWLEWERKTYFAEEAEGEVVKGLVEGMKEFGTR